MVQLTAMKVENTLLVLADISVRYSFAQCFACFSEGAMEEIVDISGFSITASDDPSEPSLALREPDISSRVTASVEAAY